jgi:sporulation protein YlmC with PRC-barrel domain
MKTNYIPLITTLAIAAIGLSSIARAQQPSTAGYMQSVEPVSEVAENFTLSKLTGKPVRGAHQEELGTIADYLIEPQSGRIHFAVVPSGSNTFRVVPMRALQPQSGGFSTQRARAEWDRVGTLTAQQLSGVVTIDDSHQQRLAQQFALPNADSAAHGLVRAGSLRGRELRAGNQPLGFVEDVVIDYNNQIATPVLATSVGGSQQRYIVPMTRLQVGGTQGAIMTSLSPNEFRQAGWLAMAPTGQDRRGFGQGNRPAGSAVNAVQQALERDAALPRGTVQVVPENRLVLRGTVENEQKKAEVERAAQQAAPGMQIENQLGVRN